MESDTNIEKKTSPDQDGDLAPVLPIDRSGSLTLRILAVNLIVPLVLVLGILYLGQYRNSLIKAETETLETQAEMFAGALAEGAILQGVAEGTADMRDMMSADPDRDKATASSETSDIFERDKARLMTSRLAAALDSQALLFDIRGTLIGDFEALQKAVPRPRTPDEWQIGELSSMLSFVGDNLLSLMPMQTELKPYKFMTAEDIKSFPDAVLATRGITSSTAWETSDGKIVMTAAAPVVKKDQIYGVIMLIKRGENIEQGMNNVRFDILTMFLGVLSMTIFLSIYLAGVIGEPLKNLAHAAEEIRQGKTEKINIPDLRHRHDEIGDLSRALYDMTQALRDRIDAIESFAADVSHELKNPLTSMKSAIETVAKVDSPADREKLLVIIQDDIQRLDRLITDISKASRLDAELSREEWYEFDILDLLQRLTKRFQEPIERAKPGSDGQGQVRLLLPDQDKIKIYGNEGRMSQVFENLITNALSFSPLDKDVIITTDVYEGNIDIKVINEGPGIPETKLETIFDRFYSERPSHEEYGRHSGLGLSIARQIIVSHNGRIFAENINNDKGAVTGVSFTVRLRTVS